MKNKIILILLLCAIFLSGCVHSNPVVGEYKATDGACLELFSDGNYIVTQGQSYPGIYIIKNNTVILMHTFGSFSLQIDGHNLIDEDGMLWTKS